jgi:rod shape-determining protein MreC
VAVVTGIDRDNTLARPTANPARIDFAIVQPVYVPEAAADTPAEPPQ